MRRWAWGWLAISILIAGGGHWMAATVPPPAIASSPAPLRIDELWASFVDRFGQLHHNVSAELLGAFIIGIVTISVTLFVAVSIGHVRQPKGAAGQARAMLLDSVAMAALLGASALCLGAIPYLDLAASRTWPGAAMLAALALLLAWLAALSSPPVVRHTYNLHRAKTHRTALQQKLVRDLATGALPDDPGGRLQRWGSTAIWATGTATLLAVAQLSLAPQLSGAVLLYSGLVLISFPLGIYLAIDSTVDASGSATRSRSLGLLHLVVAVWGVVVVVCTAPLIFEPWLAAVTLVILAVGPVAAWKVGRARRHFRHLERHTLGQRIERAERSERIAQDRLRAEGLRP